MGYSPSSEYESTSRLQLQNERYRALVESTDDWLWEVDEQMRFTYSSPRAAQMLGCNPEDLIGQRRWDHMSLAEARRLETICGPLVKTRQKINQVVYHVQPGKYAIRKRYIESSAAPFFDSSGVFRGYRGRDRDITERKELEVNRQQFQDMLAQIEEAGIILDKDAKITYLNDKFYRLFGYTPEEILNKPITILDPESYAETVPASDVIARLKSEGRWEGETRRLTKTGKKIPVYLKAKTLKDEDGNILGYLGTYFDLSPYKSLEKNLRKTLSSAIHAISVTVEKRDPYTYGHQQRVAMLCVRIAKALGKSNEFIRGLEMGAMIHDIGKIHIPSEILNRPGKLTEHEMGMIKTHAWSVSKL
jgi:PAS domain S-box-containing protein